MSAATRWIIGAVIASIWVIWLAFLIYDPFGASLLKPQNGNPFSVVGTFGDAFGVIASLMTTVAAAGVYLTYSSDREGRRTQEFESNFFTLLRNLESITSQIELELFVPDESEYDFECDYDRLQLIANSKVVRVHKGRAGLTVILCLIRDRVTPRGYNNIKVVAEAYEQAFSKFVTHLGHYFRTLYHVYRLIEEKCPADKLYYGRIVRSQLSNPEVCLLAYNCIVGEGRYKFKKLATQYSLFHNIHRENLDEYERAELAFFQRKLPKEAFRFDQIEPITYDD